MGDVVVGRDRRTGPTTRPLTSPHPPPRSPESGTGFGDEWKRRICCREKEGVAPRPGRSAHPRIRRTTASRPQPEDRHASAHEGPRNGPLSATAPSTPPPPTPPRHRRTSSARPWARASGHAPPRRPTARRPLRQACADHSARLAALDQAGCPRRAPARSVTQLARSGTRVSARPAADLATDSPCRDATVSPPSYAQRRLSPRWVTLGTWPSGCGLLGATHVAVAVPLAVAVTATRHSRPSPALSLSALRNPRGGLDARALSSVGDPR